MVNLFDVYMALDYRYKNIDDMVNLFVLYMAKICFICLTITYFYNSKFSNLR